LEGLNATMQQTEGSYRGELTMFLRRSFQIAASSGERAQQALHDRLYLGIDRTWARLNRYSAGYMSFTLVYNFLAARIVAYAPGFLSYTRGQIGLKNYVTGAELVNQLISECSWFIHVMPAIASLKANSRRVIEVANAIEDVQTPPDFYARSGRSEFRYGTQDSRFGLTVRSLELTHQGHDAAPFMRAANMRFKPGTWTMIGGRYGGGKTSFLKAINGLWPYGRGMIVFPEKTSTLFAAQEIKLPRITLKQLVCLPHVDDGYSDVEVAAAVHKAGLGAFIENLGDETRDGAPWDQLLSGGQKQMLMLARILLHRPGLLFLDEATSALDPASRVAFHQAVKDNCPGITVISIMHDAERPRAANGADFYDHVVTIENGMAVHRPILPPTPTPAAPAQGAEATALRVPNVRLARVVRAKPDR
ncbi:MAG: ATP-binding cassette domain-containing protein, partial [Mesorhizobium sp.]|nr:ATP-binding cassette domain-containing protein [Mesorhizobium sp.]